MVDTRYKTFWRRVGAMFLDGLFLWPVTHNVPDVKAGSPFSTVVLAIGFGVGLAWLALFAAEVVSSLTNDRRRSIHDAIADTVVVKTSALGDSELRRVKTSGGHADSRAADSGRGW